ncbi:hypothetical protein [uncultured Kordia sp.]|uniref:hypothetical protein n=1 Tax=uncultured Kordia sp. TaxID=507699 RepID=UPI002619FB10|nr:hypothetical protein [uncultured Kordia sp.]
MKTFNSILILIVLTIIGCKQQDTSHQDIYDFMQIVIKEQKLDKNYAIRITPESGFNQVEADSVTLDKLILKIQNKGQKKELTKESPNQTVLYIEPFNLIDHLDKFTEEDISEIKQQKSKLDDFQWDNSKLGFNQENKDNWYVFSIPLFSKDRTKAVMMIRDLCPGLCGNGKTIVFTKTKGKWISSIGNFWLH